MCGILGLLGKKVDNQVFFNSLNRLSHRGPDGYGIWNDGTNGVCFGHRRLSIIDLSENGKQPFFYSGYVLTFNGEIYNYLELRKELLSKGYNFSTESDSEVLIASYMEWGENCLLRFNGMWSFAIYDKFKNSVFLSRDRFGKKPLFYYQKGEVFAFASEMKALTPFMDDVKIAENFQWMVENTGLYETTEYCLIQDIKRFPGGHYGYYDLSGHSMKIVRYWDTLENLVKVPEKYDDQVSQFRDLFIDSCKLRMRSDVPVGTALSGGLDSSGVICTMAHIGKSVKDEKATHDWQHAYVACFPGTFLDERKHAENVVDHIGIKARYLPINAEEGIQRMNDSLYYFEELFYTSPNPMASVYRAMAEDGVKVSMDGHGVDEAFSGYGKSIFEAFLDSSSLHDIKNILNTYRQLHPNEITIKDSDSDMLIYFEYMWRRRKTVLRNVVKKLPLLNNLVSDGPIEKLGNFNYNLYLLFHQSVLPTLLRNYDRYSMMNGVEIRMPFMDHRLISYAFSLPWQSKIRGGFSKSIIRDALKDFLPPEIRNRKQKIGFQTPLFEYIKGPWKNYFEDIIYSESFQKFRFSDVDSSIKLFKRITESDQSDYNDGTKLWMQLVPFLWEQAFFRRIH